MQIADGLPSQVEAKEPVEGRGEVAALTRKLGSSLVMFCTRVPVDLSLTSRWYTWLLLVSPEHITSRL